MPNTGAEISRNVYDPRDISPKLPGSFIKAFINTASSLEQQTYEVLSAAGGMARAGEAVFESTLGLYEKRLDELAAEEGPLFTNPFEAAFRCWEIGAGMTAGFVGAAVRANGELVKKYGDAADLILEAQKSGLSGFTQHEVVAGEGFAELWRFKPEEQKLKEPLVFVFPPMNRPEVLDLVKGRSFIQYMTNRGVDLYVVSWGGERLRAKEPGWEEERNKTLGHDVLRTLPRFIRKASEIAGSQRVNLGSYCLGTLISAMYLAVQKEIQSDIEIPSAFMWTPVYQFDPQTPPNNLFQEASIPVMDIASVIDAYDGVMSGEAVDLGARMRDPVKLMWGAFEAAMSAVSMPPDKKEFFMQMLRWLRHPVDFPGPKWKQIFEDIFRHNKLAAGNMVLTDLDGTKVPLNLGNITVPVFQLLAGEDDIVDASQSSVESLPNSRVNRSSVPGAHVSLVLAGEKNGAFRETIDWVAAHSTAAVPEGAIPGMYS